MDFKIKDRIALVCGSSRGLGLAIARTLAVEGCRVAINGREVNRVELASDTAVDVAGFPADVRKPAENENPVRHVREHFGRLDKLVCNAGVPPSTVFSETPQGEWGRALALNHLSSIHLRRAAVPGMREQRWGRIVCVYLTGVALQVDGGLVRSVT